MKITAINIPEDYLGLRSGRVAGFGDVVLLAGPNGAGKTRLLRLIQQFGGAVLTREERIRLGSERANMLDNIAARRRQADAAVEAGASPDAPEIINILSPLVHWDRSVAQQSEQLSSDKVLERDSEMKPVVVSYDVERTVLRDWKDVPQREVQSLATNVVSEFSVRIIPDAGLSAVRTLINRFVYASHAGSADLESLLDDIRRLKDLIRDFIGADLSWDSDGDPTLFGSPIATAGLSSGQLVLLQVAMSLFFQRGDRDELVLLMDEPERHLHPLATITMIDEIRRKCPKAQLWIATHSLHILAHANPSDIWFVKDGAVEHAGAKSLEVLHSLVGGDKGVDELLEFVSLPAQNALMHFATQCLLPPAVVDTNVGDPQTTQMSEILSRLNRERSPLRVLDFGMGKGRLLSELIDCVSKSGDIFAEKFDYYGIDIYPTPENREMCDARFALAYGAGQSRYFTSLGALTQTLNESSFDVIVLCNTLHEVPPEDWLQYFGESGRLTRLLRESGYILVVEDQLLPAGERAHRYGYLVLDAPEIRALTVTANEDASLVTVDSTVPRYHGRLRAHLVPATAVRRVSSESRRRALTRLRDRALESAQDLSGEQFDTRRVRRFAFWCHQHVNASLALQSLYGPG